VFERNYIRIRESAPNGEWARGEGEGEGEGEREGEGVREGGM